MARQDGEMNDSGYRSLWRISPQTNNRTPAISADPVPADFGCRSAFISFFDLSTVFRQLQLSGGRQAGAASVFIRSKLHLFCIFIDWISVFFYY